MRLRGSTWAAAFAVAVAGFVGSMTGVAWAPKNLSTHVVEAACDVKDQGAGAFLGSFSLTGFTTIRDQLFAVGTASGTCTTRGGNVVVTEASLLVPVSVEELSCHELDLLLGDTAIASSGMTVDTSGTHVYLSPGTRGAMARFCAAERLAATRPFADMLTPLSQLLFQ